MKNIITMLLSVALLGTMAVGGTLALTARDVTLEETVQIRQLIGMQPNSSALKTELHLVADTDLNYSVCVANVGTKKVYVRTVFAFENTADITDLLELKHDDTISVTKVADANQVMIDGTPYQLYCAVANAPVDKDSTIYTLNNIRFNDPENKSNPIFSLIGDDYHILTVSQAVQADGFNINSAEKVLNIAFGEITATKHPWNSKTIYAANANDLIAAVNKPKQSAALNIVLLDDIAVTFDDAKAPIFDIKTGNTINLNLNGHRITAAAPTGASGAVYTIGKVSNGTLTIENSGAMLINGIAGDARNMLHAGTAGSIAIKGGIYINFNPAGFVPDGYEVVETKQENQDIWYSVVRKEPVTGGGSE